MEILTAKELAEKMKVSKQTISNWVKDGCPRIVDSPYRFDFKEVLDWLKSRD